MPQGSFKRRTAYHEVAATGGATIGGELGGGASLKSKKLL